MQIGDLKTKNRLLKKFIDLDNMTKDKFLDIDIVAANHIEDYKIVVVFSDKKECILNFSSFISHAKHPAIKELLNIAEFKKFKIDQYKKDIHWGDFDVVFNIEQLYTNKIY